MAAAGEDADIITKYIFGLIDILYKYFGVFFAVFANIFSSLYDFIKAIVVAVFGGIYDTLKAVYFDFIYPILKPIIQPIYEFFRALFGEAIDTFMKVIYDFVAPFLSDQIYVYLIGFFIYVFAVVYYNARPGEAVPPTKHPGPAAPTGAPSTLGWAFATGFNIIQKMGKFFYLFIFSMLFVVYYLYRTFISSKTYTDLFEKMVKEENAASSIGIILFLAMMILVLFMITAFGPPNTSYSRNAYLIVFLIGLFVLFYDKLTQIGINTVKMIISALRSLYSTGNLFPDAAAAGAEGNTINNTIISSINTLLSPIAQFLEYIQNSVKSYIETVGSIKEPPKIMYLLATIFLLFTYFSYSVLRPQDTTNIYYFLFLFFIIMMVPILYKSASTVGTAVSNLIKIVPTFALGIISIITMYITQTAMNKNTIYQTTPEQMSDKTVFNILFFVYSAIVVFYINVKLMSPEFNPVNMFYYIIMHAMFIAALVYYSVSYKLKLRNRIEKSSNPTADMSSAESDAAEVAVLGAATGISGPPSAAPKHTLIPNDNISPHEQMYRI